MARQKKLKSYIICCACEYDDRPDDVYTWTNFELGYDKDDAKQRLFKRLEAEGESTDFAVVHITEGSIW